MRSLRYERLVLAYHGCDRQLRDRVLLGEADLEASENDYDWLGRGIYFWEHGPERAFEWAEEQAARGKLREPAVLGAVMYLGECFDLLDVQFTGVLGRAWEGYEDSILKAGGSVPENKAVGRADSDFLLRVRDCAVMNWTLDRYEARSGKPFHTVRGLFQEGPVAFPGSQIRQKSHIQIAVRDRSCIAGYFLPK